ncbi:ABC transporter permease [Siminovitchia acidinfaciens]|uniref:ABC transporter permease n=1 Tax=Siminovitchia acidinfaciens TaxID=2321395 RepID=A0A429XV16_9BACI|nr:ABC transporter permease [Siminovitchia acidinfaciens]RST72030.1 ABC transporter permease [Siminovitchia acidinfaciens]
MGKARAIAVFEIKRIFKRPQSYLLMFGMPLLFTFIFGGLFSSGTDDKPSIAVIDHDQSTLSQSLINELENKNIMNMSVENAKKAKSEFKDQKITGYIRIDEGFEEQILKKEVPKIVFVHSPSFNGATMIEQVINDNIVKLKIGAAASSAYQDLTGDDWKGVQKEITGELATASGGITSVVVTKSKELDSINNMTAFSAGFTIMFVMIAMLISTGVFLEARQTGVWYRMMSAPVSRKEILLGYLGAFFLIGWIQFGVLMLISKFVFNVHWGNVFGNFILVSSLLLCIIGLGLFIAGLVKTTEQQTVFGNLIIVSTCMLAGVYWPVEVMPEFMQKLAMFVPQYWGLEGFAELSGRGGSVMDVLLPSAVLLAFTVVFLTVGMARIRFE